MPALETLKRRAEFLAVNAGARVSKPGFVLLGKPRPDPAGDMARFGLTVARKSISHHQGNAVVRNRIRRRLRALALAGLGQNGRSGWDYVLIGRDAAFTRDFAALQGDLESALEMLHKAPQGPRAGAASRRARR